MTELFVSRNDALKFGALTRENLFYIEAAKSEGAGVHVVTQLVNSLFGLVVFAWEQNFVRRISTMRLSELERQGWPKVKILKGSAETLEEFVKHLRNSFAHGRIRFSSDSPNLGEVVITIEDKRPQDANPNWSARMSAAELRAFCLKLGELLEAVIG